MQPFVGTRRFVSFLSIFIVLLCCIIPVQAATEEPTYTGSIELTGKYTGNFELTSSDLNIFDLEDIVPGDEWVGKIYVKNTGSRRMEIAFLSIVNSLPDDPALYNKLNLYISLDGEEIYSGSYGTTEAPISKYYPIKGRDTICFDVVVSFPVNAGNEYQDCKMESVWTFDARYYGGSYDEPIQTGYDLSDGNTGSVVWLLSLALCLWAAVIIFFRLNPDLLKSLKHKYNKKGGHSNVKK